MTTATALPGRDEREELSGINDEILDTHEGIEHSRTRMIRRVDQFRHSTSTRVWQVLSLGYHKPELANIQQVAEERASIRQKQHAAVPRSTPERQTLHRLARKSSSKYTDLRTKNQSYLELIAHYEREVRLHTPERATTRVGRWWQWLRGEAPKAVEARRKLELIQEAQKDVLKKLESEPREKLWREFGARDRDLRSLVLQHAPELTPKLSLLLQSLAAGDARPLKKALTSEGVDEDTVKHIMAAAEGMRGTYSNLGWRALGLLGAPFSRKAWNMAKGHDNVRSVELAAFYADQADEEYVFGQLSVAGQMRTMTSLPVGSVLTVDGRQMALEKVQEKKGRLQLRLIQIDDPRQVTLLDVTDPERPILRRAVKGAREVACRAYRQAGSPLPAFALAEARSRTNPVETAVASIIASIADGDTTVAQNQLTALEDQVAARLLPGDDVTVLQDALQDVVMQINDGLTRRGTAERVRLDGQHMVVGATPAMPVIPSATPASVPVVPSSSPDRAFIEALNPLLAALQAPPAVSVAAVPRALTALQPFVDRLTDPTEKEALVRRMNESIVEALRPATVPVTIELISGRLEAVPFATPVSPEQTARLALATALESRVHELEQLSVEHQANDHDIVWWRANAVRYADFRRDAVQLLDDEARRTSDNLYRSMLSLLSWKVKSTIEPNGDFTGSHPAIAELTAEIRASLRSLRP